MANLAEDITNVTWSALEGIANNFGLGPLVANFAKSVGYNTDSATLTKAVQKIIQSGKIKSEKELADLQNKLSDIPAIKSNLQADIFTKYKNDLRDKINKKTAQITKADQTANLALNRAANQDFLTVGQKNKNEQLAEQEAKDALKLYEKEI